jgi:DNA-binding NtrC family response regulator
MPKDLVLCVDDEPAVLRACSIAIEAAGFRLLIAEDGVAGLQLFEDRKDEICLVLSDVVMPRMNGISMAEAILAIDADARILLMSGYSDQASQLQSQTRFAFIRKPFIHTVLIDKIRNVACAAGHA